MSDENAPVLVEAEGFWVRADTGEVHSQVYVPETDATGWAEEPRHSDDDDDDDEENRWVDYPDTDAGDPES